MGMVDTLTDCLNKEKYQFELKGLEFEADLANLYSNT